MAESIWMSFAPKIIDPLGNNINQKKKKQNSTERQVINLYQ